MRAAIAAETTGIPSVSIICEGFAGQAAATARGLGFDGLPLAMTIGHVDTQPYEDMVTNFLETTVDQIVEALTGDGPVFGAENDEPSALDVVASGSIDEIHDRFVQLGWSDGSPVIPPTRERVETFLEGSGHDPWKTLGISPSSGRDLTIWSIAVNAVMAGCRPEHLPILTAITKTLADPRYGSEHSGNTTGADALILFEGPNTEALGFNHGPGAQREGVQANTSVGRWLRLYLRNVCGLTLDEHDKATFGNPARPVLAADFGCLTEIGWPTLAQQIRPTSEPADDDVVTMARMNSGILIGSVYGSKPEEIVPYLADGLARTASWDLTHVHGLGTDQFQPLLVLSPLLARTFSSADWTVPMVQAALYECARITAASFERYIGEWSNLSAGRPKLHELVQQGILPSEFGSSEDPNRLVPIVTSPQRILIAVAGDPNRANAYAFANDGPHGWWTSHPVDHTPASDLVCNVGGNCS